MFSRGNGTVSWICIQAALALKDAQLEAAKTRLEAREVRVADPDEVSRLEEAEILQVGGRYRREGHNGAEIKQGAITDGGTGWAC